MNRCPCCGVKTDKNMLVSLETNAALIDGHVIQLRGREAEILKILSDKLPSLATSEELTVGVYGQFSETHYLTVQAVICNLNRKLRPLNFRATPVHGVGYILVHMAREAA